MLVINRTPNTLTNLTVELSTMGDLRLVERPQSHTIGPLDSRNIRANIKVTEMKMMTPFFFSVFCYSCVCSFFVEFFFLFFFLFFFRSLSFACARA